MTEETSARNKLIEMMEEREELQRMSEEMETYIDEALLPKVKEIGYTHAVLIVSNDRGHTTFQVTKSCRTTQTGLISRAYKNIFD